MATKIEPAPLPTWVQVGATIAVYCDSDMQGSGVRRADHFLRYLPVHTVSATGFTVLDRTGTAIRFKAATLASGERGGGFHRWRFIAADVDDPDVRELEVHRLFAARTDAVAAEFNAWAKLLNGATRDGVSALADFDKVIRQTNDLIVTACQYRNMLAELAERVRKGATS